MALTEYASKRKFKQTPEPKPGQRREENPLVFVVHKHAARRLHYDFRIEMDGALKSWAVPKGPSLDPSIKRLAVMVEDHPLDYQDFEGVIPKGNYGAGGVIVWDRGFYHHPSTRNKKESEKRLLHGLMHGHINLILHGEKLQGEFALVKTALDEKSWLLIKKNDRFATQDDILSDDRSVLSGTTLEDIAKRPSEQKGMHPIRLRAAAVKQVVQDAPVKPMPHGIKPMLATQVRQPFDHPDWLFEVKWDGYRAIAEIRDGKVSLYSRKRLSLDQQFPPIADALKQFGFSAAMDGEIVVVDDAGRPDFQRLQHYAQTGTGHLVYYVFDLLHLQGHDLSSLPLIMRKALLKDILPPDPRIRFSAHVAKDGIAFFNAAREKGLEGIMAKHAQSPYTIGKRSRQWLKVKTRLTQDAVIAGFTQPRGRGRDFGSLVLGVFEGNELIYIGHSGGGFGAKDLHGIRAKLEPLVQKKCPFKVAPETNTPATWVRPELVCEISFSGWTEDGILRQPVFMRLREDKAAQETVRDG